MVGMKRKHERDQQNHIRGEANACLADTGERKLDYRKMSAMETRETGVPREEKYSTSSADNCLGRSIFILKMEHMLDIKHIS